MSDTLPYNTTKERDKVKSRLAECEQDDNDWQVVIEPLDRDRTKAQLGLLWAWNREVSKQQGDHDEKWVHGYSKHQYLLPLYKSWGGKHLKRAMLIEQILHRIPLYEHKVFVCYDLVRTPDSVKKMAEYLTVFQQKWGEKGVRLESNNDLEFKSLLESRGDK